MKTPSGKRMNFGRNQGEGHHDDPPTTGAPREDTVNNRWSQDRSVRSDSSGQICIPVTVITVSEIQQTDMGIDLCMLVTRDSATGKTVVPSTQTCWVWYVKK